MSNSNFPNLLGPLAPLQVEPDIMEIVVDAPNRVYIVRSATAGTLVEAGVKFDSAEALRAVIDAALALGGIKLSPEQTTGEVRLPDGSRLVAVVPPTAVDGPCLVIRKPDNDVFTWDKLLKIGTLNSEAHTLLMKAIDYRVNVLVTGNDGSGRTYIANLMAESLPAEARVIVVANAFEIPVRHPRRIHLETGGPANLSMVRVLETAAKMRPDWLVIGDMQGSEAMKAVQLMRAGHRAITTLYASSPEDALIRLESMCLMANPGLGLSEIRAMIAASIGLITYQQNYTLPDYRIKITRIVEVQGLANDRYLLQPLLTYNVQAGKLEPTDAYAGWAERTRRVMTHG
jgi:pilus assembly protein CpaF